MAPKKSAAAKAKTQPADVKKEQTTKARRAAKSKAAALDVPEVSEELYKRHNALSYQIWKGGDSSDRPRRRCGHSRRHPEVLCGALKRHYAAMAAHLHAAHDLRDVAKCGEERAVVQSLASSRSNGEPACCAFRDAHDENLKAMGEPEYWWTMDSLVEAAAEKEAQSAVAHASHVVQPPSHQESMQTRTMKRLAGGIRRLNKLSDRPCACALARRSRKEPA